LGSRTVKAENFPGGLLEIEHDITISGVVECFIDGFDKWRAGDMKNTRPVDDFKFIIGTERCKLLGGKRRVLVKKSPDP